MRSSGDSRSRLQIRSNMLMSAPVSGRLQQDSLATIEVDGFTRKERHVFGK